MRRFLPLIVLLAFACATQSTVTQRLETTPRHDEWVRIPRDGRTLHAYVSYPEIATKAPAVLVIHENRGLVDWVRSVADRLAENGFIAIAPDLLSGMAPGGGRTSDFSSQDAAREAISALPPDQVIADLNAAADYVRRLPAANGTLHVAGFCWGGGQTWRFAAQRPELHRAFVFYGTGPQDPSGIADIRADVFGFYGGADTRVNATIDRTAQLMREAGKRFEYVIYEGAGHGFMRAGEEPNASAANREARNEGWARWLVLLKTAHRG